MFAKRNAVVFRLKHLVIFVTLLISKVCAPRKEIFMSQ